MRFSVRLPSLSKTNVQDFKHLSSSQDRNESRNRVNRAFTRLLFVVPLRFRAGQINFYQLPRQIADRYHVRQFFCYISRYDISFSL